MNKTSGMKKPYPLNLMERIMNKDKMALPQKLTRDILAGVQYALSDLTEHEREIIHWRYEEEKSTAKTAEILGEAKEEIQQQERNIVLKLRKSYRWNFMCNGIMGYTEIMMDFAYRRGYEAGYHAGIHDERSGIIGEDERIDPMKLSIANLRMSLRPYNCLKNAGYNTVGEVAALDCEGIEQIQKLGVKGKCEIANALRRLGIDETEWSRYE